MHKDLLWGNEARASLEKGVDKLANAVKLSIGPKGRNAVYDQQFRPPEVTNDGATIAGKIYPDDPYEIIGSNLIREVANKTNEVAGDGTTTATIIAHKIIKEGLKNIAAGAHPVFLKRGMDEAVKAVEEKLKEISIPVDDKEHITHVASISADDRNLGELIAKAFEKVGKSGVVMVDEGRGLESILEYTEGIKFDKGYISQYFITDHVNMTAEYENVYILMANKKINKAEDLLRVIEEAARRKANLLIIAQEIKEEALSILALNKTKGVLNVCAVEAPGFGDTRKANMQEMALLTGATLWDEDTGLELKDFTLDHCGKAGYVLVKKEETIIRDTKGDKEEIQAIVNRLWKELEGETESYEREKILGRISRLTGGISVIKAGGASEVAMLETKQRLEDAVNSTRSAIQEGVVPGGGTALIKCCSVVKEVAEKLEGDEKTGAYIIKEALKSPLYQIAENAGVNASVVVNHVMNSEDVHLGYDALNDKYTDMMKAGIIDPTKVVRLALRNAASVAGMFLTTEAVVVDLSEEARKSPKEYM